MKGNIVEENNILLFNGVKRFESAGVKIVAPSFSVFKDNIIRNNFCAGMWVDGGAGVDSIFMKNQFIGNKDAGLKFEIGN